MKNRILGMIMAGGKGERLYPLTLERAKPAVPFGGKYRIVDFVLSNFINSGIYSLYVLTQFKSQSLLEHLQQGWRFSSLLREHFITPVPAQMRMGGEWYMGTADAIRQNMNLIDNFKGDIISVFGADHIYRMDIMQMVDYHDSKKTNVTVAALPVPLSEASDFGVINVDEDWKIIGFDEKPEDPQPIPGRPGEALISMGNYIFNKEFLRDTLMNDLESQSKHDFGKHILPSIYKKIPIYAYDFRTNKVPGVERDEEVGYWRDVGTVKAYWEANMDLRNIKPVYNLYNRHWPIKTASYSTPPAKLVFDDKGKRGMAINSILSEGSIIQGGTIQDSVLGRNVSVKGNSAIINSILMDYVEIGENCKINMAIIDKGVSIPSGTSIGYDLDEDRKKYYVDEESQIIVLSKKKAVEEWG